MYNYLLGETQHVSDGKTFPQNPAGGRAGKPVLVLLRCLPSPGGWAGLLYHQEATSLHAAMRSGWGWDGQAPGGTGKKNKSLKLFLSDPVEHRILPWAGSFKSGHWERRQTPAAVLDQWRPHHHPVQKQKVQCFPLIPELKQPVLESKTQLQGYHSGHLAAQQTAKWTADKQYHTQCINFEGWPPPWRKEGISYHKTQKNGSVRQGPCMASLDMQISCQSSRHQRATSDWWSTYVKDWTRTAITVDQEAERWHDSPAHICWSSHSSHTVSVRQADPARFAHTT